MEISPVSFTGAANCARRKMMTPTKLKKHAKNMTLASIENFRIQQQKNVTNNNHIKFKKISFFNS